MLCLFTYRYGPGQSFGKHVDDSVEIGNGVYTEYTLLIYLTGAGTPLAKSKQKGTASGSPGLVGGETIFYGMLHLVGSMPQHCPARNLHVLRHASESSRHHFVVLLVLEFVSN